MMAYFKGDLDFDGIAFSTTIRQSDKSNATQGSQAVEFFFPTAALRCYEMDDCTAAYRRRFRSHQWREGESGTAER
jgi:hypothetical protein